ncbi:MAG: hypothetical protein K0Q66_860 [Chitinophagaceae bacterium]|jgi:hypothetical protein|nr:hypothetical protein [Chitinophagaceae bacterium]
MFLTANALSIRYGIDDRIAKFFVDRDPPKDNLYWKDKQLYLRPKPGYIFLPLIVDLFYRSGISLEVLLSEAFVHTLEKIGHYAAEEEGGLIDKPAAVRSCRLAVAEQVKNRELLDEVTNYLNGRSSYISTLATAFPALHRGDLFLFSLCVLNINGDKHREMVIIWFALISTLLLMDDAEDVSEDKETGEENAFIQSGLSTEGFEKIKVLVAGNIERLSKINKSMAETLHKSFANAIDKPGFKEYLNN